jgi:hypothetical protein
VEHGDSAFPELSTPSSGLSGSKRSAGRQSGLTGSGGPNWPAIVASAAGTATNAPIVATDTIRGSSRMPAILSGPSGGGQVDQLGL